MTYKVKTSQKNQKPKETRLIVFAIVVVVLMVVILALR